MIDNLDDMIGDGERAGAFARHVIEGYLDPAFGSRSKVEIDLLLFTALIKAKAIDPNGPIYPIARAFNISPGRARTLILNWQLRDESYQGELTDKLRAALSQTRFSKDGTYLTFGIESPLLKEEIVARLKKDGVFADATFTKDIVRLPVEAFVEFLDDLVEDEVKAAFVQQLVRDGQVADRSFKGLVTGVLGKMASKVGGGAPFRNVVPLRFDIRKRLIPAGPVLAGAMVTRMDRRAQRPPRLSSPQLKDTVGAVTEPLDSLIASPLVRVTTPLVEILKVVADTPRMVLPNAGELCGEMLTCAATGRADSSRQISARTLVKRDMTTPPPEMRRHKQLLVVRRLLSPAAC